MAKQFAKLQRIEGGGPITRETHYDFLWHLQRALLLALLEQGKLNAMEYRYAEERLKQQRRSRAKRILEQEQGR